MDTLNMPPNENNTEPNHGAAGNAVHKFHKLRSVLASAVTVTAVTSVVALCSGCNGQSVSSGGGGTNGSDSATAATSQEQETTSKAYEAPEATDTRSDTIEEGASFLDVIAEERRDGDGVLLTMDELVYGAKANSPAELTEYPDTTCSLLSEWVEYNRDDLAVTRCEVIEDFGGDMPILGVEFSMDDNDGYGDTTIFIKPGSSKFTIRVTHNSSQDSYEYESTEIPDVPTLCQIIRDNNL